MFPRPFRGLSYKQHGLLHFGLIGYLPAVRELGRFFITEFYMFYKKYSKNKSKSVKDVKKSF
jgi:hypothetical protein